MKHIILIILFAGSLVPVPAAHIRNYFKECPDIFFPMLTHNNKLDLLDFMDSKMDAVVKNIYGEQTRLLKLTDDYLKIKTSASSQTEMKLLPMGRDTLLCIVKTLWLPEPESEVSIVAAATMKPVAKLEKYLVMPAAREFYIIPEGCTRQELEHAVSKMDVPMVSASLDEDDMLIRFVLSSTGGFVEDREEITPFVRNEIVARWNGKKFVRTR